MLALKREGAAEKQREAWDGLSRRVRAAGGNRVGVALVLGVTILPLREDWRRGDGGEGIDDNGTRPGNRTGDKELARMYRDLLLLRGTSSSSLSSGLSAAG